MSLLIAGGESSLRQQVPISDILRRNARNPLKALLQHMKEEGAAGGSGGVRKSSLCYARMNGMR